MIGRAGLLVAATLALQVSVATSVAAADTIDVTRFDDPTGPCSGRSCSLRQAILAANAATGPQTITLHAGTYRLTLRGDDDTAALGDLDVSGDVTIEGDGGAGATVIDCTAAKNRAFDVLVGGALTIRHVTVRKGNWHDGGGAIANAGTLTVENCAFSRNRTGANGGAIRNVGTLTVNNSTFTGNRAGVSGGAVSSESGTCTLTDVVVAANKARNDGGGCEFLVEGTSTITRATIARNRAGDTGGGVDTDDGVTVSIADSTVSGNRSKHEGGGLDPGSGTLTLTNVTVSGNRSAQGGGIQLERTGVLVMTHATVAFNKARQGAGVWVEAGSTASLHATIVAKNKPFDCFGPIESQGFNLIGRSDGCTITGDATGNIVGGPRPHPPVNPRLGPLAFNGGTTATHALLAGSPAIGAVAAGCPPPALDQRGQPRAAPCDIGAYELP